MTPNFLNAVLIMNSQERGEVKLPICVHLVPELMPGAGHARCSIQAGSCSLSSLGIHDENDSVKYTKLLATQIKGFVLSTAKAVACEINLQQVLCL